MSTTISNKKKWVATSGWRGNETFIDAVGGANDTGSFDDSPCPSKVSKEEINAFCAKLRAAGIKYRTGWGKTSNVFCVSRQVMVSKDNRAKALEIAKQHEKETRLFYSIN